MVVTATLVYPAIGEKRGYIFPALTFVVSSSASFLPLVMKFRM